MEEEEDSGGGEGAPAWMATFADMSTLLLTFFVLLLSFANMDVQNFRMALGSVREALGVITQRPGYYEGVTTSPIPYEHERGSLNGAEQDQNSASNIEAIIQRRQLQKKVFVEVTKKKIILRIHDLFEGGATQLRPRSFEELDAVVEICQLYRLPIHVEAHTDDRPIRDRVLRSNWELSAVRAGAVARYLVEAGRIEARRVAPVGYASTRPLSKGKSKKARRKNRRVEVVLYRKMPDRAQVSDSDFWSGGRPF